MSQTGIVSDLQHFSTGDGPGIRTTVFLKGCNLRCEWCHNPETISTKLLLLYYQHLCNRCDVCQQICPQRAHKIYDEKHFIDRDACILCGICAEHCITGALQICGKELSVSQVLDYILEDCDFYETSGGGVTISGGEPLIQADFTAEIAAECKRHHIHVIVDTAGHVDYTAFQKAIPYTDVFYFDLKGASEEDYRQKTGGSLIQVLENMDRLVTDGCDVVVRIPIIPEYNNSEEYCKEMAELLIATGIKHVLLLPFHRLGASKYQALGLEYSYKKTVPPTKFEMQKLLRVFIDKGFEAKLDE